MALPVPGDRLDRWTQVLIDCFGATPDEFAQVLFIQRRVRLSDYATSGGFDAKVFAILQQAEAQNWLKQLLMAAAAARPEQHEMRECAEEAIVWYERHRRTGPDGEAATDSTTSGPRPTPRLCWAGWAVALVFLLTAVVVGLLCIGYQGDATDLRAELDRVQPELTRVDEELAAARPKLIRLGKELDDAKRDLALANTELAKARTEPPKHQILPGPIKPEGERYVFDPEDYHHTTRLARRHPDSKDSVRPVLCVRVGPLPDLEPRWKVEIGPRQDLRFDLDGEAFLMEWPPGAAKPLRQPVVFSEKGKMLRLTTTDGKPGNFLNVFVTFTLPESLVTRPDTILNVKVSR
jgi:hypothetical protein